MKLIRNIIVFFVLLTGSGLNAQSCTANFTYIDSVGYVFFINNSSPGQSGNYIWTFGDGNFSYMFSPSNPYASPGVYQVCLIAYDSMQNFCDSTCMTVYAFSTASAVGQSDMISAFGNVQIAPNPARESFEVLFNMNQPGETTVSLYDLSGRKVSSFGTMNLSAGPQRQKFSTNGITAGTYLLRIESEGKNTNTKIVIAQ